VEGVMVKVKVGRIDMFGFLSREYHPKAEDEGRTGDLIAAQQVQVGDEVGNVHDDVKPYKDDIVDITGETMTMFSVRLEEPDGTKRRIDLMAFEVGEITSVKEDEVGTSCPWCESKKHPESVHSDEDPDDKHRRLNPWRCVDCGGVGGGEDFGLY
jgi:hypothetical protein